MESTQPSASRKTLCRHGEMCPPSIGPWILRHGPLLDFMPVVHILPIPHRSWEAVGNLAQYRAKSLELTPAAPFSSTHAPFSGLHHTRGLITMFFSPKCPSKAWPCLCTLRELRGSKRRKRRGRETEEKGKKGSVYHLGEVRRRELVGKKEIGAPGGEGGGSLTTTLSLLCLPSGRRTPKVLQDTLQQPCTGFKLKICYWLSDFVFWVAYLLRVERGKAALGYLGRHLTQSQVFQIRKETPWEAEASSWGICWLRSAPEKKIPHCLLWNRLPSPHL